mmetsp:Transcript_83329/g.221068  ORF Transcript_83329/g.221068 Transcript_83329/m.221068 type:complete len:219 (+) Transcript_83329:266-922(+)
MLAIWQATVDGSAAHHFRVAASAMSALPSIPAGMSVALCSPKKKEFALPSARQLPACFILASATATSDSSKCLAALMAPCALRFSASASPCARIFAASASARACSKVACAWPLAAVSVCWAATAATAPWLSASNRPLSAGDAEIRLIEMIRTPYFWQISFAWPTVWFRRTLSNRTPRPLGSSEAALRPLASSEAALASSRRFLSLSMRASSSACAWLE